MKFKNFAFAVLLGSTALFIMSCGKDEDPMEPGDTCESADLTYTNFAGAFLNSNCATSGCHGEGTVTTFEMHNYATAFSAVGFNRIIGAINHDTGFSPMPKGGTKLSDCNIEKMTTWIQDGAPE